MSQRDDVSALISMGSYTSRTLTGPSELISRKIQATNNIALGDTDFSQISFRILASAGRTLMRSRAIIVLPLRFTHLKLAHTATGGVAAGGVDMDWRTGGIRNIGPRKSCGLQMMRQVAVTVNSTTAKAPAHQSG